MEYDGEVFNTTSERSVVRAEVDALRGRDFNFQVVMMVITRDHLGHSHVAEKVIEVVRYLVGTEQPYDTPEAIAHSLAMAASMIVKQYPQLEAIETGDILPGELGDIPDAMITLWPPVGSNSD